MAATTLAVIVKSMNRPPSLRSSGSMEMPAAIESAGLRGRSSRPSTSTLPDWMGRAPKIASQTSVRPAPRQAGQAHDLAVAQREGCRDHRIRDQIPDLEGDGASVAARRGSGSKESSRPTISEISSPASTDAVSRTPVTRPSFITVTRSEISKISAMRCET